MKGIGEANTAKLKVFGVGSGGVNLVRGPLQLEDTDLTQAQNAEFILNEATGGVGVLSKRGGLAALNGSAMAGTVLGMIGLPLETTYTRTLYAARQTESSNTFTRSTNGTTWANTASPVACNASDKFADNTNNLCARRAMSYKNFIIYGSDAYTQDTDNPEVAIWDGTDAFTMLAIPLGPSSNGSPPFVITDWLVANNALYLAISDPGGSAPDLAGRVLSLDFTTGQLKQIANAFGNGTGEVTGGSPACLAFYLNQLWVGLNGSTTTDGIGKIVRAYPGVDTTWTSDVSNLRSHITSLMPFKGDLYAATRSSVSAGATITKRSVTAGTWATQVTSAAGSGGTGHYDCLYVHGSALWAVEYHTTTPVIHILTSTDGASWSTSRDVDSADSGVAGNLPGQIVEFNNGTTTDLYVTFTSTTAGGTDGFILRRSGGTWSKPLAASNIGGPMAILLERT